MHSLTSTRATRLLNCLRPCSLGILTRVTGEGGIIPRSISHIFGFMHAAATSGGGSAAPSYNVSMSFCQLYLDTIQDLLAPADTKGGVSGGGGGGSGGGGASLNRSAWATGAVGGGVGGGADESFASGGAGGGGGSSNAGLAVREDPARGFYVEGLSEYNVSSWGDAIALLNAGLENRVLGATRMNATSSRSHTILTIRIEARTPISGHGHVSGYTSRRSQLMLCDLAGSERVRRTSSRGARLEEARAINASLHTLGQVISALSVASTNPHARVHIPWRDSKLTRLLYGNIGGSCNTYLLATVGPAFKNVSETLSTLMFASRCMRVASTPITALSHTQVDYAEMCASLQARLAEVEAGHAGELGALQKRYELALLDMQAQLDVAQAAAVNAASASLVAGVSSNVSAPALDSFLVSLAEDAEGSSPPIIRVDAGASADALGAMLAAACGAYDASAALILSNQARAAAQHRIWARAIARASDEEGGMKAAQAGMAAEDLDELDQRFGSHLGQDYSSAARVMHAINMQHSTNNVTVGSGNDGNDGAAAAGGSSIGTDAWQAPPAVPRSLAHFGGAVGQTALGSLLSSEDAAAKGSTGGGTMFEPRVRHPTLPQLLASGGPEAVARYTSDAVAAAVDNMRRIGELFATKDAAFDDVKRHLAAAEAAVRTRDEDLQNTRYVLRYLVDTITHLREHGGRAAARPEGSGSGPGGPRNAGTSAAVRAIGASTPGAFGEGYPYSAYHGEESAILDVGDTSTAWLAETGAASPEAGGSTPLLPKLMQRHSHGRTPATSAITASGAGAVAASGSSIQSAAAQAFTTESWRPPRSSSGTSATGAAADSRTASSRRNSDASDAPSHASMAQTPVSYNAQPPATGSAPPLDAESARAIAAAAPSSSVQAALTAARDIGAPSEAASDPSGADGGGGGGGGGGSGDDEVEYIVAHRVVSGAAGEPAMLYKVHWRGASASEDEWFPRADLVVDFPHVVRSYEAKHLRPS